MRTLTRAFLTLSIVALLAGCATVYTSTVTITQVVDTAMKGWADLSVKGFTSAAVDTKVIAAHNNYRQACAVTQTALIAYKQTGDNTAFVQAMAVAKAAASGLIDLIVPLLTTSDGAEIKDNLAKATTL